MAYHPYHFVGEVLLHPIYNMGSKLDSFLRKECFLFCFVHVVLHIVKDNAKTFTSVGLSYKNVILFSKIFYMFDVVYVKSNSIAS